MISRLYHNKVILILGLIMALGLHSCTEDIVETDQELIPYFELFAAEAAKRNITVDYEAERIEGLLQYIDEQSVLGQCFRNNEKPRKVIIHIPYWNRATELEKEFLIFHELGHCFLNRDHDDRSDNDGVCLSIMHSTPDVCEGMLTEDNKEAYLDELFN